jgi:hypothetical protein
VHLEIGALRRDLLAAEDSHQPQIRRHFQTSDVLGDRQGRRRHAADLQREIRKRGRFLYRGEPDEVGKRAAHLVEDVRPHEAVAIEPANQLHTLPHELLTGGQAVAQDTQVGQSGGVGLRGLEALLQGTRP